MFTKTLTYLNYWCIHIILIQPLPHRLFNLSDDWILSLAFDELTGRYLIHSTGRESNNKWVGERALTQFANSWKKTKDESKCTTSIIYLYQNISIYIILPDQILSVIVSNWPVLIGKQAVLGKPLQLISCFCGAASWHISTTSTASNVQNLL